MDLRTNEFVILSESQNSEICCSVHVTWTGVNVLVARFEYIETTIEIFKPLINNYLVSNNFDSIFD